MKRQLAISILLLHLVNVGTAQEKPALPYADRVRLADIPEQPAAPAQEPRQGAALPEGVPVLPAAVAEPVTAPEPVPEQSSTL